MAFKDFFPPQAPTVASNSAPVPEGLRGRIEGVQDSLRPAPGWRNGLSDATHSILAPIGEQPAVVDSDPRDIRAAGWSVAVHNDYRLNGEPHTFWLFTHPGGQWVRGEGRTDAEALNAIRAALIAEHPAAVVMPEEPPASVLEAPNWLSDRESVRAYRTFRAALKDAGR